MVTLEIKDCCVTTKADVLNTLKEIEYRIEQGYNSGITTEDVEWILRGEEEYAEKDDNKVYERCIYCEREVELLAEFKVQECPNCGRNIIPCSLCSWDVNDCSKCELLRECNSKLNDKIMIEVKKTTYMVEGCKEPCFEVTNGFTMVRIAPVYHLLRRNSILLTEYIDGDYNSEEENLDYEFDEIDEDLAKELATKYSVYL